MHGQHRETGDITDLILKVGEQARLETSSEHEPKCIESIDWPVNCTVGPGLEGAIACESKVGFVNGTMGRLIYRGYDIFDLCAYSTFEEVSYLLLYGNLPTQSQLDAHKEMLVRCRDVKGTLRTLLGFPVQDMSPMAALRLGTNLMRQEFTKVDVDRQIMPGEMFIGTDEDSIAMETLPRGGEKALYEFEYKHEEGVFKIMGENLESAIGFEPCYHLISGVASLTAAISRIRQNHFPIEPNPDLGHAANLLYMMTGKCPTPEEERIMDIALILHADHGMNASTFAAMVVASTLSDIYFSVGSGIAALNGPLHGGANELVLHMLKEIQESGDTQAWYDDMRKNGKKILGFGHRVYKTYDPRARVLEPLAKHLVEKDDDVQARFKVALELEQAVTSTLGKEKGVFPNVDFYSGIVYHSLGLSTDMFTPIFSVSRVAGWTSRVMEYLENNRIFRPRSIYTGPFGKKYNPIEKRSM